MRSRRLLAIGLAIALGGGLWPAPPSEAQGTGRTWHVFAGGESPDKTVQVNTYRPARLTVGVGDQVTWLLDSLEQHSITFLSGGDRPPGNLRIGDVSFRNPQATLPAGGGSYSGQGYVNSGYLNKGDNFSLTFTAPGTYEYVCLIHGAQRGTIEVQASAPAGQSQPDIDLAAALELSRDLERGESAYQAGVQSATPGSVHVGGGAGLISVRAFGPSETVIQTGQSVTWSSSVGVPHTVSFTSGSPNPEYWQRVPQAGGTLTLEAVNPQAATKQGGDAYGGSGFVSSGVMTSANNSSYELRFTQPGTYEYVCLIHLDFGMRGKVTVLP